MKIMQIRNEYMSPSNAVRIWRGFKNIEIENFANDLKDTFIPVTIKFMQPLGLKAYMPLLLQQNGENGLADELALVFYLSQSIYYRAANKTSTGRAYEMLHHNIFKFPDSTSDFPSQYTTPDKIKNSKPYFLYGGKHDWQLLCVYCVIKYNLTDEDKLAFYKMLDELKGKSETLGLSEMFFFLQNNFLCMWTCWRGKQNYELCKNMFSDILDSSTVYEAKDVSISPEITKDKSINFNEGDFINVEFNVNSSVISITN